MSNVNKLNNYKNVWYKKKILFLLFQLSLFTSETGLIFAPKMRNRANTGSKTALELFKSKTLGTDIENILSTSLHMPTMFNDFFVYRRSSSPLLLLTGWTALGRSVTSWRRPTTPASTSGSQRSSSRWTLWSTDILWWIDWLLGGQVN